ncbi:MAG: single-stranded-DNA-specific exonuclease RecJ [Clostridia bacterium]|nr:single-stranded-DNA-specific exonuclease RecJ [Clostridia bacterium]
MEKWLSEMLIGRGINTPEKAERYLHPTLDRLYDPFLMQDMEKAVQLIREALKKGERIQIYGDYDTDGVCSSSILMETLSEMGARVDFYIPNRSEGYGLNEEAVKKIAQDHQMLITVDCGISNHAEVALAKKLGMCVIVTDHHQLPEKPVPADAILNPLMGSYPFPRLCGAGVALKLTQALLGMEAVERRIDLAALATVADIVPLVDENRIIVRSGMKKMETGDRPGLKAMMDLARIEGEVNAGHLGFRLVPRINAGGRLEDASQCVHLLLSRDSAEIKLISEHLEENNRIRQQMQQEITEIALKQIAETVDFFDDRIIVVMGDNWNPGVIGLAAGRICEMYHYPTIVLSNQGDRAVGSCRSIPGVNIFEMLGKCRDLFQKFGGHEQAAGLTMDPALVGELRRRMNLVIRESCDITSYIPFKEYDVELDFDAIDLDFIERLKVMEPTGFANPAPVFLTRDAVVQSMARVGSDMSHLKLTLMQHDRLRGGIAFGKGQLAEQDIRSADLIYVPQRNEYRGRVTPQVMVQEIRDHEAAGSRKPLDVALSGVRMMDALAGLSEQPEMMPVKAGSMTLERLVRTPAPFGTLIIALSEGEARRISRETGLEVSLGRIPDPRPFSQILLMPSLEDLQDVWHRVVLAGSLPGLMEAVAARCPRAEAYALTTAGDASSVFRISEEEIRRLFVALRQSPGDTPESLAMRAGLSQIQTMLGLRVYEQAGLIALHEGGRAEMLPLRAPAPGQKKAYSLSDSRLYRYLRALDA